MTARDALVVRLLALAVILAPLLAIVEVGVALRLLGVLS